MDPSAVQRDQPTSAWPSIADYWPDESPGQEPVLPPAGPEPKAEPPERDADGITWIRPEGEPGRRRWRVALGGMLAATLLVVAGAVLASLIKQAHESTPTAAEPVAPPQSTGALDAPLGPTGAASIAPAPSAVTSSSPAAKTVAPPALPATATFELAAGSPAVTLQTRDLGTDLYRVTVGKGASGDPKISDSGAVHRLTVSKNGKSVAVPLDITLNAKVRWTVRVTGGIKQNVLNFHDSDLTAIELAEGASKTELTLPPAKGTLPVRVTHGVHTLQIIPDGDDPVRAQILGGANKATVLGLVDNGVAKGTVLTSRGWATATDRIDVIATGGLGSLTVTAD